MPLARINRGSQRATAPPAGRWQRALLVIGVLALGTAPSACTASGRAGGHAVQPVRARAATSPQHRPSGSPSVQLVVEASGDLLIHSAVFDRALVLGGGRHYDFAPMFAQIKPYIQGADLRAVPRRDADDPGPSYRLPDLQHPARPGHRDPPDRVACLLHGRDALPRPGADRSRRHHPRAGSRRGGAHRHLLLGGRAENAADHDGQGRPGRVPGLHRASPTASPHLIPGRSTGPAPRRSCPTPTAPAPDGAQVVIVNLHWGDQYVAQPSSFQLALASQLTRSPDITAIVGQHVHIVQPIRILQRQARSSSARAT